jgi:trehalose-6-phosphate synthase
MEPRAGLILANRAYCDHELPPGEESQPPDPQGGLLAAVRPAVVPWDGMDGTLWIGAGRGACDRAHTDERGFEVIETARGPLWHRRLYFDDETWRGHYAEAANGFLWPLMHLVTQPLPDLCAYYPAPESPSKDAWARHREVNHAFAAAALESDAPNCWVHDYQLGLVPKMLREGGYSAPIGFFLHTPFADLDVAGRYLDERSRAYLREFVAGVLGADLVGVQSEADAERLRRAAVELGVARPDRNNLRVGDRRVCVGAYPVGIDPEDVLQATRGTGRPARITAIREQGLPVVLGLERADFTKGIPERLAAVEALFGQGGRFAYMGLASPTREGVPGYETLGPVIANAAARCDAAAREAGGWFHYAEEAIPWNEVVALQREADVVFTSSLADGLNLVPLQAAIAQSERPRTARGVIIAGRDAGVSQAFAGFEKDGLVPVDPLDKEAMAAALGAALRGEPGRISDRLIAAVHANDARRWATSFLADLEERRC